MQCMGIWAVWDVRCLSTVLCQMKIVVVALNKGLVASCVVACLQQQLWMVLGSVESLV